MTWKLASKNYAKSARQNKNAIMPRCGWLSAWRSAGITARNGQEHGCVRAIRRGILKALGIHTKCAKNSIPSIPGIPSRHCPQYRYCTNCSARRHKKKTYASAQVLEAQEPSRPHGSGTEPHRSKARGSCYFFGFWRVKSVFCDEQRGSGLPVRDRAAQEQGARGPAVFLAFADEGRGNAEFCAAAVRERTKGP